MQRYKWKSKRPVKHHRASVMAGSRPIMSLIQYAKCLCLLSVLQLTLTRTCCQSSERRIAYGLLLANAPQPMPSLMPLQQYK